MLKYPLLFLHIAVSMCLAIKYEAHCSKFHYEEQTLERMIRTELKVEEMQKTLADSLQDMNTTLQTIQKTNEDFIKKKTAAFNEEKVAVEKALLDLKTPKESTLVPTIAFSARGLQDLTPHKGERFVFSNVLYNHGGSYESTTGLFTAPVNGSYLFTVHLCAYYDKYSQYGIIMDGKELLRGTIYDSSGAYACSSASTVAVLKQGQEVWVQGFRTGDRLYEDSDRWNMFSGTILHK